MASDEESQTVCVCPPSGDRKDFDSFPVLLQHLKRMVRDNIEYFSKYTHKPVYKRFHDSFTRLLETAGPMEEVATFLAQRVTFFDYSPEVKGNGYRSLLRLTEHAIRSVTELTYYCVKHRDRFYFRAHHYSLEVEAYTDLFSRTRDLLQYAMTCFNESKHGHLFPHSIDSQVMIEAEEMDRECFYGRTLGFQYVPSLRHFLHFVCVLMASFAEGYHRHKASPLALMTASFLSSGKYTVNPEMRAKMIIKLTKKTNMDFCKAFWGITEGYGIQHFPLLVCPALKVNRVFQIAPEPFELLSPSGEMISIAPPCSWSGLAPVQVRLMSYEWREGQSRDGSKEDSSSSSKAKPKANGLVFHIHGGGFVAQSSKSHEVYLRMWARDLNVPIISVDYSLAPEAPFPRALEECFFAYAWALKNPDKLGTTMDYVCIVGDSAGGNLSVALCMRAAEYGIRRPDSVLTAYAPFNVQYIPSPSRLLSLMDPLLPLGILEACLKAYGGLGKSPFEECVKFPGTKSLANKKVTSPIDIKKPGGNHTRPNSFLSKFRNSKSVQSPTGQSHSLETCADSGGDSFHSCVSSPSKGASLHRNKSPDVSHIKGSPDVSQGRVPNGICNNGYSNETSDSPSDSLGNSNFVNQVEVVEKCQDNPGNKFDSIRGSAPSSDLDEIVMDDEMTNSDSSSKPIANGAAVILSDEDSIPNEDGNRNLELHGEEECMNGYSNEMFQNSDSEGCERRDVSERPQFLELNVNDKSDTHLERHTQRKGEHDTRHMGVQYRRSSDECVVVNVVESPTGEEIIEPYLCIGTPPSREEGDTDTPPTGEEGDEGLRAPNPPRPLSMSEVPLPIAKNPYMSPLLAPDEMLNTLPPIDIVACTLDPILDDSVEFARRLRSLGKQVELYILDDLPHGFLNFNLLCQEAKEGCDLCTACLKRTLMGKRKPDKLDQPPVY